MKQPSELTSIVDSRLGLTENGHYRLKENKAEDIAEALEVGVEWLLHGDETKNDPVNHHMIEWLRKHPEIRKEIWNQIHQETE